MEKRRVVKSGKSSCVVSLPKKWIEDNKIRSGDYVNLTIEDNIVKISKDSFDSDTYESYMTITEKQRESLEKKIISAYLTGFHRIVVHIPDGINKYINDIQKVVDNLFGVEIIRTDDKKIWIESMIKDEDVPIQDLISRMVFLTKYMVKSSLEYIETGDKDLARMIKDAENQTDKIHLTLIRNIVKTHPNTATALLEYRIIRALEIICDYAETMTQHNALKKEEARQVIAAGQLVLKLIDDLTKIYLQHHGPDIDTIFKEIKSTYTLLQEITLENRSTAFIESVFVLKNMLGLCRDLGELYLNKEELDRLYKQKDKDDENFLGKKEK
jgi:phosphate uptake regulator